MADYTVRSGDNLSKIARSLGLDVRDLIAANPQLSNPNLIQPGQSINVPSGPASQAARTAAGNVLAAAPTIQQAAAGGFTPQVAAQATPQITPIVNALPSRPVLGPGGNVLGQAFPRDQATLTPQGVVSARASAGHRQTYPRGEPTRRAIPQPATTPTRQPSQVVSPYSGRSMASDAFRPSISPATVQQLDYLDRLTQTDPTRAAEVARFQAATIGRTQPESALATNVFFTERAINNGQLPRNASERVWDVIASRMGLGVNGAQLLSERGYIPIGGGLWYLGRLGGGSGTSLGSASTRDLSIAGGGGDEESGGRFLRNASGGLFNWRISA